MLQGKGEGWDAVGMSCSLSGIAVRKGKCGKTRLRSREKFFIDNSAQGLITFKERHRGLLKLYLQLGEGVSV